jgi:hypothetical protein
LHIVRIEINDGVYTTCMIANGRKTNVFTLQNKRIIPMRIALNEVTSSFRSDKGLPEYFHSR